MARRNYRTKVYTKRLTSATNSDIEKLRQSALAKVKANDWKKKKFIQSQQFDKLIRKNIKENRYEYNRSAITKIADTIGDTKSRQKVVKSLFGEKQGYSLTSKKQTQRLKKIQKEIAKGEFNIIKYVKNKEKYRKNKGYIKPNPGKVSVGGGRGHVPHAPGVKPNIQTGNETGKILDALDREEFYYQNKSTIKSYNDIRQHKGFEHAKTTRIGRKLRDKHYESENIKDDKYVNLLMEG